MVGQEYNLNSGTYLFVQSYLKGKGPQMCFSPELNEGESHEKMISILNHGKKGKKAHLIAGEGICSMDEEGKLFFKDHKNGKQSKTVEENHLKKFWGQRGLEVDMKDEQYFVAIPGGKLQHMIVSRPKAKS